MKGRIIFLVEEASMSTLLEGWLPRLFPGWVKGSHFLCVPHEGKTDLDRSIPRKLKSWQIPDDRFIIIRDTDNRNCIELKREIIKLCDSSGRPDTLVRLVCQELESWYLGDLTALAKALAAPKANTPANQKRFVDPDIWQKPSAEVKRLAPHFQKISGARLRRSAAPD